MAEVENNLSGPGDDVQATNVTVNVFMPIGCWFWWNPFMNPFWFGGK